MGGVCGKSQAGATSMDKPIARTKKNNDMPQDLEDVKVEVQWIPTDGAAEVNSETVK